MRFAFLWFAVPLAVTMLAQNQRTRYLLPLYPGAALLVAWWADAHGGDRTRAAKAVGWLGLAAAGVAIAALGHPEWFGPDQRPFIPGFSWVGLPLAAAGALMGVVAFWGLQAGRPALLIQGIVVAMMITLGYGIWPYNARFNEVTDFKRLAASVERHASGAEAGVFGGRWFSIDFYMGRPLRSIRSVEELNEFLASHDRPVVVVNGRTWDALQGQTPAHVRAVESTTILDQRMFILQDGAPREGEGARR